MKPAVVAALFALPLFATSAQADTTTVEADTLVVVTPNAPIVVQQGTGAPGMTPVGDAENPPGGPHRPVVAAASAAPQNEDWNNVSHINGVPVKVGERGAYLVKFRKTNIMANPFGVFFGYYDASISHAVGQNLAVSVAITGYDLSEYDQGLKLQATLPLYFRRTYSGPFLEGGLVLQTDTSDDYDYAYAGDCYDCYYEDDNSNTSVGPTLLFGWHWTFDSGLNTSFAFGLTKRMDSHSDEPDPNGYFRVGYAF